MVDAADNFRGGMRVWLAILVLGASCRFDLPKVSGVDESGDAPGSDGPIPPFRSCLELPLTCGPKGTENCCEPAETIPGGTFLRGYDAAPDLHNDMNYPATVSTFVLDKYEVTVGRFRKFVQAGMGTQANPPAVGAGAHPTLDDSGWDRTWNERLAADKAAFITGLKACNPNPASPTWTDAPGANENKPINCVTWYEAMAFCIWDGGYLPTEAEWNYAASGGSEQRVYPWSNPVSSTPIDCTYANYYVNNPTGMFCVNDVAGAAGAANPVGSESPKGDGRWGHSDLAGNMWEWMLDWQISTYPLPCNDCANLQAHVNRVIRGGGYIDGASTLRVANRKFATPTTRVNYYGLRCARAL